MNENSWTKVANMIFVDLPAGTGFSYSKTWEAFKEHVYEFSFTKFLNNPLYISGISYMGIVIPATTIEVYKVLYICINKYLPIYGYRYRDAYVLAPYRQVHDFNSRLEFAHRLALISDDIYEVTLYKKKLVMVTINSDPENTKCSNDLQRVDECTSGLNIANILDPACDDADPVPTCREAARIYLENWANHEVVQKALHVREGIIETWYKNNDSLHYDMNKEDTVYYSMTLQRVDYHRQLVARNSQVLVLNGDHDMNFPYVGTEKWIKSLNLPIESPWNPWFVGKQVAGYKTTFAKNGYTLTYATIKGAGHAVALYKPEEALAIVDDWLSSHNYLSDF
ncbi:hypothetical protein R6Q59_000547 [Mikania micrantha]